MAQAEKARTAEKPKAGKPANRPAPSKSNGQKSPSKVELAVDKKALKKLKLVAVAYSHVEREWFPTEEAYIAEKEVEERAQEVLQELDKLGIPAKCYPGDQYLITNLLVDQPNVVLNLVDTLRGKDSLQTSVPAALELANIPYTGADMQGLVIGNNRNLTKQLLEAFDIPSPAFQFIRRAGTAVDQTLGLPLIVKLNESGGSVGIDNTAVKESYDNAQKQVDKLISTYKLPVIIERFIDGPEITAVVYDDGKKRHVFLGEKLFRSKPDGKHYFTSLESYDDARSYTYKPVDETLANKIVRNVQRAFGALMHRDYAKFDIRVDEASGTPYITDSNPNTAFGPDPGLPFTEVINLNGVQFPDVLASMMSKYAKKVI
jgi:D-alanine-D-alanine ligase